MSGTSRPPSENSTSPSRDKGTKSKEKLRKGFQQLQAASLGWNFVTAPLVGGGLGYLTDSFFGIFPWITLVGMALGFISAFIEAIRGTR